MSHPSYCCQNCGDFIGWMGRFMFPFFHKCRNKTTKHMTEYTTQTTSIKFDKNFINPAVLIHHDGRVTIGDGLKPDEAAKQMFNIFKDLWANDAQSVKIRDLELRILKLKTAGNEMYKFINPPSPCMRSSRMDDLLQGWDDAKDKRQGGQAVSLEERILFLSESPDCNHPRELRAIALDVRKLEDRVKQLEEENDAMRADLLLWREDKWRE